MFHQQDRGAIWQNKCLKTVHLHTKQMRDNVDNAARENENDKLGKQKSFFCWKLKVRVSL